jgi:Family of unknown function (DUF5681)
VAKYNASFETRWRKGQSGNPGGRPKRKPLTDLVAAALEKDRLGNAKLPNGQTLADMIVLAWVKAAMRGDAAARKDLLERLEGKVAVPVPVAPPEEPVPPPPNEPVDGVAVAVQARRMNDEWRAQLARTILNSTGAPTTPPISATNTE